MKGVQQLNNFLNKRIWFGLALEQRNKVNDDNDAKDMISTLVVADICYKMDRFIEVSKQMLKQAMNILGFTKMALNSIYLCTCNKNNKLSSSR